MWNLTTYILTFILKSTCSSPIWVTSVDQKNGSSMLMNSKQMLFLKRYQHSHSNYVVYHKASVNLSLSPSRINTFHFSRYKYGQSFWTSDSDLSRSILQLRPQQWPPPTLYLPVIWIMGALQGTLNRTKAPQAEAVVVLEQEPQLRHQTSQTLRQLTLAA